MRNDIKFATYLNQSPACYAKRSQEIELQSTAYCYTYRTDDLHTKSVITVGGISTSTEHIIYDGQMPVCEQDFEDGVLKQTRIHLLGARGIEGIITVPATGVASLNWLFYDGHGNLVRTMNTSFALSTYQWRGVWGERTTSTPSRGYCANLGHPEDETGLVYMRARYYEPGTGRFISEDPARDGVNWYLYADGDPVGKVDADGLIPVDQMWAFLAGFFFGMGAFVILSLTSTSVRSADDLLIKQSNTLASVAATLSMALFGYSLTGLTDISTSKIINASRVYLVLAAGLVQLFQTSGSLKSNFTAAGVAVSAMFVYLLLTMSLIAINEFEEGLR